MNLNPLVIISLAAVLLASQVAVIIALIVLCKKFKTLKQVVQKYKVKKNRESLSGLIVKDPKSKKPSVDNQYVDGKRHPSTMVRSNSKESIVYVPTPASERRSKNFGDPENGYELNDLQSSGADHNTSYNEAANVNESYFHEEDEVYGNQVVIDMVESSGQAGQMSGEVNSMAISGNNPSTPCIEDVTLNSAYTEDTEEIYGNQSVIDMAENAAASKTFSDVQNTSQMNTARSGATKTKKSTTKAVSKKVMNKNSKKSFESEKTIEADNSAVHESNNTDANNEPIYENWRGQTKKTSSKA